MYNWFAYPFGASGSSLFPYALMRADHCARDRNLAYANNAYGRVGSARA